MTNEEAIKILRDTPIDIRSTREDDILTLYATAQNMAIEALQGDMYCPNCGVRLVPENEYLEPTQTHGRLIDADALSKKLCGTTIFIKDGEVFQRMINDAPTVQADRPHGEWYRDSEGTWSTVDFAYCSECKQPIIHKHASPLWNYCPNCGSDMRKGGEDE